MSLLISIIANGDIKLVQDLILSNRLMENHQCYKINGKCSSSTTPRLGADAAAPKREHLNDRNMPFSAGFVQSETVTGSGIGIESRTESRIENGIRIRIESGTRSEVKNGTRVENEFVDGTRTKTERLSDNLVAVLPDCGRRDHCLSLRYRRRRVIGAGAVA
ncbi:hypothetical protein EVAR_93088_1 [Eumeta japonica]|uniref:Uncharacterized protein n=1 Tax=Eumeta variegata TaxID=151549 RepID=A0A4C1TIJ4_EUMVA|nr:hypothetical protein EVAR_93088_1 [Eumeta japonica]